MNIDSLVVEPSYYTLPASEDSLVVEPTYYTSPSVSDDYVVVKPSYYPSSSSDDGVEDVYYTDDFIVESSTSTPPASDKPLENIPFTPLDDFLDRRVYSEPLKRGQGTVSCTLKPEIYLQGHLNKYVLYSCLAMWFVLIHRLYPETYTTIFAHMMVLGRIWHCGTQMKNQTTYTWSIP